jgi:hypothetical protein
VALSAVTKLYSTNLLKTRVNAGNKEAALVAANYIASAGSMFTRASDIWGTAQAFNPEAPSMKEVKNASLCLM